MNILKFNGIGSLIALHVVHLNNIDLSQVDYSYPPLFADTSNDSVECPDGWKYLPTLALPDGSHNFAEDTVFFNLPSLKDPRKTVYGISCYVRFCILLLIHDVVFEYSFCFLFCTLFSVKYQLRLVCKFRFQIYFGKYIPYTPFCDTKNSFALTEIENSNG